jgi:hypothetical protein
MFFALLNAGPDLHYRIKGFLQRFLWLQNEILLDQYRSSLLTKAPFFAFLILALSASHLSAGTFIAFGPESYTRGSGTPVTVTNSFTVLNPNAEYTLQINNGGLIDGELKLVSSSIFTLNGVQVVGPSEFNQNVPVVEKPVSLASNNKLSVELRRKPGGGVTVQIVGVDNDPPSVTISSPPNGTTVNTSLVTVSGTVNDATSGVANVTCNGVSVSLSGSSFSCDVPLINGPNAILVEATDLAGNTGASSITVTLALGSVVIITSPASGSVINTSPVFVEGVIDVPVGTEVGVTVNGVVAFVSGDQFAVLVPVDETVTSLTATATDPAGSTGSDTIQITVQPGTSEQTLLFRPSPAIGTAPLTVSFTLNSLEPITQFDLDLDGDGIVDFQGTSLEGQTFSYPSPGLFFPVVTVTDDVGGINTATALVQVLDIDDLNVLLQSKWTSIKDSLRQGNIDDALDSIAEESRERYQGIFNTLSSELSQIDSILTYIQLVTVRGNQAEFTMLRTSSGSVERSFYILFVRDNDGIWRLRTF